MAMQFGNGDYITFGNTSDLHGSTFTNSVWIYRLGNGAAASTGTGGVTMEPIGVSRLIGEADGDSRDGNYAFGIRRTPDDKHAYADFESYNVSNNNNPVSGGPTGINNDVWIHIAHSFDGATHKIYLNGVLQGQTSTTQTPRDDSIQHAAIGRMLNSSGGGTNNWWNGYMAEVCFWNTNLEDDEVYQLFSDGFGTYNVGTPLWIQRANLRGYWPLDDAGTSGSLTAGKTVRDWSDNGNHGTVVGTLTGVSDSFLRRTVIGGATLYGATIY